MNIWDILIAALVIAVIVLAVRFVIRGKKTGKCSCGDCSSCAGCGRNTDREETRS